MSEFFLKNILLENIETERGGSFSAFSIKFFLKGYGKLNLISEK